MSKAKMLRALVEQRLSAAAEEIFGLFERTVAEYEEELSRSKEENERQQKLLDAVFNPQLRLHRTDDQQPLVSKKKVPTEQQEWSSSVDQEDPEAPQIKEEQEELWTSQEGEQLQGLEEAQVKISFTPVHVKSEEDDEEKDQSSQLHHRQTEQSENRVDGEDCGRPEPPRNLNPEAHFQLSNSYKASQCYKQQVGVSDDWKEISEPQPDLNFLKNNRFKSFEKLFRCSVCGKFFNQNSNLKTHMRIHTGEKPFSCSFCGKRFGQKTNLQNHLKCHTGEKPYSCAFCNRCFARGQHLQLHMRTHTGEKPFSCNVCGKRFTWLSQFKRHNCGAPSRHHELWTSQEGEQLQGLEEVHTIKFPFTSAPVQRKEGEEKPQSSQLHQRQIGQIETEAGGPKPARNSHPFSLQSHGLTQNSFIGQFW